ncbi:hypothetical protein RD792_017482 [Penstemon davidsonii]|uniref:Major facilitator superfamily (MFS) profile domain-containing protein n=1 Tax=Penstemon davidsonii TaxID=160366 RepID=A0ABR0CN15_9LAMI|nr:hypothetical protein RD792_017482 [Penstemon davidsonii]
MGEQLQVLNALDVAKTQLYHFTAIVIAGMGFFTDAYDLFSISLVAKLLGRLYYTNINHPKPGTLPPSVSASVTGVALVGTLSGQLFFGWLGDKMGRKKVYGMTLLIMIVCSLASGLSFGSTPKGVMATLCFFRFWLGFGIGGDYPLSATIMSEYANKKTRGAFIAAVFASPKRDTRFNQYFTLLHLHKTAFQCHHILRPALRVSEDEILEISGLDALVLVRLFKFGIRFFLVCSVVGLLVLLPLNYVAGGEEPWGHSHTMDSFTISSISKGSDCALVTLTVSAAFDHRFPSPTYEQNPAASTVPQADYIWRIVLMFGAFPAAATFYWRMKMPETARYTALVAKDAKLAASDMAKVLNVEIQVEEAKVERIAKDKSNNFGLFSKEFVRRHGLHLFGTCSTWFLLDIAFYSQNLFQKDVFSAIGWIPPAKKMNAVYEENRIGFLVMYALTFFFANFGPNATTFVVPAEVFPARLRSTCHGISAAAGKAGAIVGAYGFLYAAQNQDRTKVDAGFRPGIGVKNSLIALGVINALGMICTIFAVPEAMGKSLEEASQETMEENDEVHEGA